MVENIFMVLTSVVLCAVGIGGIIIGQIQLRRARNFYNETINLIKDFKKNDMILNKVIEQTLSEIDK